jgi:hypothetical protein
MVELKDVLIRVASNPQFHQVINIVVIDILESYDILLSRVWSQKFQRYFTIINVDDRVGTFH